ncbi:tetratricopeptide repeat protein [Inhella gelatinilytica]|uniref:Tetratricopeptide repeat protein n=1 Tax=Inhella gelatinilytica TaxID=2795030 RepID=A0A931ISH3_9BURK|nr:tetratricopeptide repeat protein [Inhella gelatinilytica]MBH9551319.1 tetratricopeptide repeat protein [Inhella gelatinilytica]
MDRLNRLIRPLVRTSCALALLAPLGTLAQSTPAMPAPSAMDAPLFYQVLVGELELQRGQAGVAFQVLLDAARRTQDDALYRRAVQVAIQARAGQEALQAARAWKFARPALVEPAQSEIQLLAALGQLDATPGPILDWLQRSTTAQDRAHLLSNLGALIRSPQALGTLLPGLTVERDRAGSTPLRRSLAACAIAQLAALSKEYGLAVQHLEAARKLDPSHPLPAWLALRWTQFAPAADALIATGPRADSAFRLELAYARARDQRSAEALDLVRELAKEQPQVRSHLYLMGSLALDLRQLDDAQEALTQYLSQPDPSDEEGRRRSAAQLLLVQVDEQRGDWAKALNALEAVKDPDRALEAAYRRLHILSRQGQWDAARAIARSLPGDQPDQPRRRLLAEVQVLREAKRWAEAQERLEEALRAEPQDTDLLYEKAMGLERQQRHEDMERVLREVIQLDANHAHARNALGYSLADRNQRLPEARELIESALKLAGHEPALVDSLGWVAFREGKLQDAEQHLRRAYQARYDAEIAAHLVEVLKAQGRLEEARDLLSSALKRDPRSEALLALQKRLSL